MAIHVDHSGNQGGKLDAILSRHDQTQVEYLKEECILVNEQDHIVGSAPKKICHLLENIDKGMLHRAFSVFLFNTKNELLLQQRSDKKITYPNHFTNTCCSHPLNWERERNGEEGVKVAARRKLEHELGIRPEEVPLESLDYVTRVHYRSPNVPDDGTFGEHEIDYILLSRRDVNVNVNVNEVQSYTYATQNDVKRLIEESRTQGTLVTPWFRMIVESGMLFTWWNNLDDLERYKDTETVHRF